MIFVKSLQTTIRCSVIIQKWSCVDTLKGYGEHYLLADKVDAEGWCSGLFKDSVFLIKKGACAIEKILHLIWRGRLDMFHDVLLMPWWTYGSRLW